MPWEVWLLIFAATGVCADAIISLWITDQKWTKK